MRRILRAVLLTLPLTCAAFEPRLDRLDELPVHVAPSAATSKAIDAARSVKGSGPALFAVTVPLTVGLEDGVWDPVATDSLRWRTRVYSASARSLLMEFSRFHLPPGAELWIYDADGRAVQGPYTARNHNDGGGLWTATVPGEMAVIELRVPAAKRDQVQLELGRLGHGFKNERDLGSSGGCNIDAVCPLGNDWRNEIRAGVKLQIPVGGGFVGVCSGTLINNLNQDNRPFILTADHCEIRSANDQDVVVYWNFQNSACGGSDDASDAQNQTGTVLRARDEPTDLSLVELAQAPAAAFNVYLAGWDATGAGGSSGLGIHHPSGDARKISEFTNSLAQDFVNIGGSNIPAWRVTWSQGTTEQGSSGSGLWNQNRQIVGVLTGGAASCAFPNDPDFYARLGEQWEGNGTVAGQLKAWLDPANTGTRKVSGKNPGSTPTPTPSPTPSTDTTPDAFDFPNRSVIDRRAVYSKELQITGFDTPVQLSISGHSSARARVNDGDFVVGPLTVRPGDRVRLRLVSSDQVGVSRSMTVNIGGVTDAWKVTTVPVDGTPKPFDFLDKQVSESKSVLSQEIQITGINVPVELSLSGHESARVRINGGTLQTGPLTIQPGDRVRLRLVSRRTPGSRSMTVTIGGVTDRWTVTTVAPGG